MYGYQYQYVRNTLQLNQGPSGRRQMIQYWRSCFQQILVFIQALQKQTGAGRPLVADFDNDGYRDIIVTNGFPKDVTDHDFMAYQTTGICCLQSKKICLMQIPEVKIHNYAFQE